MIRKVLITIGSLLVLSYLLWAIYYFTNPSTGGRNGRCNGIEIKIVDDADKALMNEADIRTELTKMKFDPVGKALDSIDILQLQNKLRSNKVFRAADVYLTPMGKVHLSLSLYDPIMLIMAPHSRYYISTERTVMPYHPSGSKMHLVACGAIDSLMATGKLYDLAQTIRQSEYWNALVTQIYVRSDSTIMIVPRVGNTDIILGKSPDWEQKLSKLKIFIDQVISRTGWDAFSSLNASFKDQIVAIPTESFSSLQTKQNQLPPLITTH